ncbi:hypothetical protein T459_32853 [Capsicum annuum]|uniref:Reverse transcriptase domain-containing protein n=1 Tax=Capsicum annuum TaxID=4072 RepID=A0A2G2Y0J4_CAPAN|nr:ATP synthase subunit C family protein [Capsicum annuum]PHT63276.1 hypothetical protein T459_32853 [Capsicum annuum]
MSEIAFLTGQPLGYYRSWSIFSFSHHYIVWLATKYAYPTRTASFVDYTLLGDDILITDLKMVEQYRKLLDRLGVTISESKSIIFDNGIIEFAKRYWTKSMQVDLSPISLRSLLSCRTTLGLCNLSTKYSINFPFYKGWEERDIWSVCAFNQPLGLSYKSSIPAYALFPISELRECFT